MTRTIASWIIVLAVWLGSTIGAFWLVNSYGLPLPYADDWDNVPYVLVNQSVNYSWLWSFHNEHRIPLPRLITIALVRLSGNDFRAGMFFNVFALSALSLMLIWFIARIRGQPSWTDAFFPICLLSPAQYENLLWSFQVAFVLIVLILGAVLVAILLRRSGSDLLIGACLILLPLCGGPGVVTAPLLLLWLLLESKNKKTALLFASAVVTILATYFVGYHPEAMFSSFQPQDILRGTLEFLATALGPAGTRSYRMTGAILLVLFVCAFLILLHSFSKHREDRARITGLAMYLLALFALTLSVAIGRSGGGAGFAGAPRYAALTAMILCAVYVSFAIYGGRILGRMTTVVLILLVVASLPQNLRTARTFGESRVRQFDAMRQDTRRNLPAEAIATRNADLLYPFYSPVLPDFIRWMKDYRIAPFDSMDASLAPLKKEIEEQPLEFNNAIAQRSVVFQKQRFLLGVRCSFKVYPSKGPSEFLFSWADSKWGRKVLRWPLPAGSTEQTHTFWIYDTVDRIEFGARNGVLQLKSLTLLQEPDASSYR